MFQNHSTLFHAPFFWGVAVASHCLIGHLIQPDPWHHIGCQVASLVGVNFYHPPTACLCLYSVGTAGWCDMYGVTKWRHALSCFHFLWRHIWSTCRGSGIAPATRMTPTAHHSPLATARCSRANKQTNIYIYQPDQVCSVLRILQRSVACHATNNYWSHVICCPLWLIPVAYTDRLYFRVTLFIRMIQKKRRVRMIRYTAPYIICFYFVSSL